MTGAPHALDLLVRSARVMRGCLNGALRADPAGPTPCSAWDLGTLVLHVADSAEVLAELLGDGGPVPVSRTDVGCVRAGSAVEELITVAGRAPRGRRDVELTALTGAFELAVHAWDIGASTGVPAPLPADLASTLLALAPVVLGDVERAGLFGAGRPPSPAQCTDTDRLLALFGRCGTSAR
ncbi:maleylpyruvate isomerase N-terminal domain-containing protein [Actinacidiphila sp. bgisy144]|uniref:maleylpyruvate isomerase N-terminal domain-containing protein n=1 Tax=unclassified Actinacidiphila TaxID=2995708 RepID=UPI003EB85BA6